MKGEGREVRRTECDKEEMENGQDEVSDEQSNRAAISGGLLLGDEDMMKGEGASRVGRGCSRPGGD